jgi:hypothetical protein
MPQRRGTRPRWPRAGADRGATAGAGRARPLSQPRGSSCGWTGDRVPAFLGAKALAASVPRFSHPSAKETPRDADLRAPLIPQLQLWAVGHSSNRGPAQPGRCGEARPCPSDTGHGAAPPAERCSRAGFFGWSGSALTFLVVRRSTGVRQRGTRIHSHSLNSTRLRSRTRAGRSWMAVVSSMAIARGQCRMRTCATPGGG